MTTLTEKRDEALTAARHTVDAAKAAVRALTPEEVKSVNDNITLVTALDQQIQDAKSHTDMLNTLASFTSDEKGGPLPEDGGAVSPARSLAEHFLKSDVAAQLKSGRAMGARFTGSTAEFKAATDPTLTTGITVPPQFGQTVQTKYRRLTVADLLASGTTSSPAITYWTQGTLTGDVATVAEGATKPSLNFAFGQVTESLTKLAGVTKVSDEMTQDLDFLVSVIQSQLAQRLAIVEEDQLLNGNGTAPNLRGLLNRTGIQTYATPATSTPKKTMDGLFHAMTLIRTGSFIEPDGVIINPLDYENVRLGADLQGQYYGGGPFTGAYGNPGLTLNPGLWTLPTVVTPAIAQGTMLVGGFSTSAQVFRKGGVRLETTNSNEDDFKKNLIAMRIEERLALAVYYPTALCKVTITA